MTFIVTQTGTAWTVEMDGQIVGQTISEATAEALVDALRPKTWVASWRFCDC